MRLSKAWVVAAKDLRIFGRKGSVLRYTVLSPVLIAIGLPLIIHFAGTRHGGSGIPPTELPHLLNAFSFFFVAIGAYVPIAIAAYSLIGEKVEKSLEPLLATPITDGELFLGKSIASFIPSISAVYIGSVIFMALMDLFTRSTLNYSYFPNWTMGLILLVAVPLIIILSIEANVLISSKANDVRAAQTQGAMFIALPLGVIYVSTEIGVLTLNTTVIWIISAVFLLIDIVLFSISTKIFKREEILTKWT